jgi:hypothetical protein
VAAAAAVEVAEDGVEIMAFFLEIRERHTERVVVEAVSIIVFLHKGLREVLVLQVS